MVVRPGLLMALMSQLKDPYLKRRLRLRHALSVYENWKGCEDHPEQISPRMKRAYRGAVNRLTVAAICGELWFKWPQIK